jgi:hypothetical protein
MFVDSEDHIELQNRNFASDMSFRAEGNIPSLVYENTKLDRNLE